MVYVVYRWVLYGKNALYSGSTAKVNYVGRIRRMVGRVFTRLEGARWY
jgi:hypothetical protein